MITFEANTIVIAGRLSSLGDDSIATLPDGRLDS